MLTPRRRDIADSYIYEAAMHGDWERFAGLLERAVRDEQLGEHLVRRLARALLAARDGDEAGLARNTIALEAWLFRAADQLITQEEL